MFRETVQRLTLRYLGIIMVISLFFSAIVYQLSIGELEYNYDLQRSLFQQRLPGLDSIKQYLFDRRDELTDARLRLLGQLALTNVVILAAGGLASYYLARRTLQPIERSHEAQKRFTADASHELRTPLTAMRTEIEVALMDNKLSLGSAKKQLRSNLDEIDRLTTLSEGLLRLSQVESNDLPRAHLILEDVITQALAVAMPLASKKNITITTDIPSGLTLIGDTTSLAECLTIVLDNAIKYSPPKSIVSLTATRTQRHIELRIHDSGSGIAADQLPHIFERFYRADSSRTATKKSKGYGLGLAIAKHIVQLHQGTIHATSTPGRGTTFIVTLPV